MRNFFDLTTNPLTVVLISTAFACSAHAAKAQDWPDIREAKAIAEEGFIYGLPIVMNYAVMYEYAVDKDFGAIQGAVQPDQERSARVHVQRHSDHHAE